MRLRRMLRIGFGVLATLLLLLVAAAAVIARMDWKPWIERHASATLARQVTIGSLAIAWASPLGLELSDIHVAGPDWGSAPDMLHIASLSAKIDLAPLLGGRLRFRQLAIAGAELLLERNQDGVANWRFDGPREEARGFVLVPHSRDEFPTLLDAQVTDGHLTYRVAARPALRLDFARLAVGATDEHGPAHLEADGAYDGRPVTLTADTDGFTRLRDAGAPFGTRFTLTSGTSEVGFAGSMMKPLDFDGLSGRVDITSKKLRDLLGFFGVAKGPDLPLAAEGDLTRDGERWQLDSARGSLAGNDYQGSLHLTETARGQPDDLGLVLRFADLDLQPVFGDLGGGPVDIRLDPRPGAAIALDLAARRLHYKSYAFADFRLQGRSAPARLTLDRLSTNLLGGRLTAAGQADTAGRATRLRLDLALDAAQAGEIARFLGATSEDIAGPVSARAGVAATAATLEEALRHNAGPILVAMRSGRIALALVEHASTDLNSLFRKGEGALPISCAFARLDLRDGKLLVNPLNLRTPDTVLRANGLVDPAGHALDVEISARGGASLLALDVPVRISGSFDRLRVAPAIGTGASGAAPAPRLSPQMADFLRRNACPG